MSLREYLSHRKELKRLPLFFANEFVMKRCDERVPRVYLKQPGTSVVSRDAILL
jgi:hypothetical protein